MNAFIAALPMYDWPEVRAGTDAQWVRLRDALYQRGIDAPAALTRATEAAGSLDLAALWRDRGLLFAQTCWGPMGQGLADHVEVIGQPDYSAFEGGQGELYSSAVVMRRKARVSGLRAMANGDGPDHPHSASPRSAPLPLSGRKEAPAAMQAPFLSPVERGAGGLLSKTEWGSNLVNRAVLPLDLLRGRRFAFNSADSMSGILALTHDLEATGEGIGIFSERIVSGGHRASIVAVAEGRADVAAIDCRSWAMAQQFEPAAKALAVVGWTRRRKGLPYICAQALPPETVAAVREAAAEAGMLACD